MLFDEVPLARLKSMYLCATSLQNAVAVPAHLAVPVDVKISLRLLSIQGSKTFFDLFSAIYKHPGGSGLVLRSLRATNYNTRHMAVQFSTSSAIKPDPGDDDIQLSIQFFFDLPIVVQPDIILDIWQIITQQKHQTFFIGELETIHFEGFVGFIWGLTAVLRIDGSYPSLRILELRDMALQDDAPKDLRDVLAKRTRHNRTQNLRLTLCKNFTANQEQLLRQVIANVDCDQWTLNGGRSSRLP
ncbi:hypothetical protein P692DRAFT_20814575 [Suillus brevipes Sb2]|nr:hypothetical protein P692DRAFT_20814575 [Suillus brevipes Sb2]